jgi:hypothetical protein
MFVEPNLLQKDLNITLPSSYTTGNLVSKVPFQHLCGTDRAFEPGRPSGQAATPSIEAPINRTR